MGDISKNRFIGLYVENEVGVLAKVSGLFSAKHYNLKSLTVGTTEIEDVSRMTICVDSTDTVFEQIKKQLNAMVEVIKVIDLSEIPVHMREIMFAKISDLDSKGMDMAFKIAEAYKAEIIDINEKSVVLHSFLKEQKNDNLTELLVHTFKKVEVVRGGSVAIEALYGKRE